MKRWRKVVALLAAMGLACLAAACQAPTSGGTGGGTTASWTIDPHLTDPALSTDVLSPNLAYLPTVTPLGRLAVVLPGTGAGTTNYVEITDALRSAGYHVIVLRYSNAVGTPAACPDSGATTDPGCFRTYRSEVVFGAGVADPDGSAYDNPTVAVSKSSSVVNRLTKLVDYLTLLSPTGGWDAFQQRTAGTCNRTDPTYGSCALRWSAISAIGHSQGAGVALYLAKFLPLHAVGMLSGPFDSYSLANGSWAPADWIAEGGFDVPLTSMRALTHTADPNIARIRSALDALGIPGPERSVSSGTSPWGGTSELLTSIAPTCPLDSAQSHNSTAFDVCAPDGAYAAAWRYLAS